MKRIAEPENRKPLRTSLALLGIGALAIGGVAVALPRLSPQPSRTAEVPHDQTVTLAAPFQNGSSATAPSSGGGLADDRQAATAGADDNAVGTVPPASASNGGQGGGPPAMDEEARDDAGLVRAPPANANGSGAPPTVVGAVPVPVPVGTVGGVTGATAGNPIGTSGVNGGGDAGMASTATTLGADGGVMPGGSSIDTNGDAGAGGALAGDGGAGGATGTNAGALSTDGDAGANPYSQLAYPVPGYAYGAPPASTSTSGPVTNGATGSPAPLWGLGGGGGASSGSGSTGSTTTDGNSGVVNPRPSIAATLMVTMSQGDAPERAWTAISPYLRAGDVVVARTAADSSANAVALLGWSDRVRTDTPLVSYVLGVTDVTKLKSMVAKGLPATLDAIGPAQTDAMDAATASTLSAQVHAAGKRFFLSASSNAAATKIPLAQVGANADVVELVITATTAAPAATEISTALGALRSKSNPLVFVRLPAGAISSNTAATSFTTTVQQTVPNVGFALPPGTSASTLADLRASP